MSSEEEKKCVCEPGCECPCDCENNECGDACDCSSKNSQGKTCDCSDGCPCPCDCEDDKCDESCDCESKTVEEKNYITIDEFKKVEMTVGRIAAVEIVEDADKLLKLTVDFGDAGERQIISGIREFFEDPQEIVGKHVPFATNLQPRTIRGLESNGMIVAVSDKNGNGFSLLEAGTHITPGSTLS